MSGSTIPTTRMLQLFDVFVPKPIALTELDLLLRRTVEAASSRRAAVV